MPALTGKGMRGNHVSGRGWCSGCGLHHHVTGQHRGDCTAIPKPDNYCPTCKYNPNMYGHHRADCPHRDQP
jgi:hypothetical protein